MILLLLLIRISVSAFAAQAAGVDIPVVIDGGGTAYMIPEVNSPLPTETAIRVDNGRTGHFYINFTEPGEYHYTITARFSDADGERDADETFRLTVTVYERDDGVLYAVAVINSNQRDGKPDLVRFRENREPSTEPPGETPPTEPPSEPRADTPPTETPSEPHTNVPPSGPPSDTPPSGPPSAPPATPATPSTPKTGDESHLTHYALLAMAASVGLFGLALLYTVNTNKLIKDELV